ncbi:MAG TPA: ABC transporter substrate-binding protein [Planctomycetota bacterium]|nr:ABC transporter substrate-binding protein [Planctomycetota bacterium]
MARRIVSLLPSATEIVCGLGARDELVGRSHECDYPDGIESLPVLTSPKVKPSAMSGEIDRSVREVVRNALGVYDVDAAKLEQLAPDVIVTQDLCDVCAVSLDDVKKAVASLAKRDVAIVSLKPLHLDDIFGDVVRVGEAIGRAGEAKALAAKLRARAESVRERAARNSTRPEILTIEWIDPVMLGGTWMPEMASLCASRALGVEAGQKAPTVDRAFLEKIDPELIVVKPCGFPVDRTLAELPRLRETLPWDEWTAVLNGRVYVADGNAYFNRPGPRIADSLEILAACIHPKQFRDFRKLYASSVVEVDPDLSLRRWSDEYIGEGV